MTEAQRIRAGKYSLEHLNDFIKLLKYSKRYFADFKKRHKLPDFNYLSYK